MTCPIVFHPPVIKTTPNTPCLECGEASIQHYSRKKSTIYLPDGYVDSGPIRHNCVLWRPRWGEIHLKTGICTLCSQAVAKENSDWCGFCTSSYWKARPNLLSKLSEKFSFNY